MYVCALRKVVTGPRVDGIKTHNPNWNSQRSRTCSSNHAKPQAKAGSCPQIVASFATTVRRGSCVSTSPDRTAPDSSGSDTTNNHKPAGSVLCRRRGFTLHDAITNWHEKHLPRTRTTPPPIVCRKCTSIFSWCKTRRCAPTRK